MLHTLREQMADSEEGAGLAVFNRVLSQWRFNYAADFDHTAVH